MTSANETATKRKNLFVPIKLQQIASIPELVISELYEEDDYAPYHYQEQSSTFQPQTGIAQTSKEIDERKSELYVSYYKRGFEYIEENKNYKLAVKDFDMCLRLKSNQGLAYFAKAYALFHLDQIEQGIRTCKFGLLNDTTDEPKLKHLSEIAEFYQSVQNKRPNQQTFLEWIRSSTSFNEYVTCSACSAVNKTIMVNKEWSYWARLRNCRFCGVGIKLNKDGEPQLQDEDSSLVSKLKYYNSNIRKKVALLPSSQPSMSLAPSTAEKDEVEDEREQISNFMKSVIPEYTDMLLETETETQTKKQSKGTKQKKIRQQPHQNKKKLHGTQSAPVIRGSATNYDTYDNSISMRYEIARPRYNSLREELATRTWFNENANKTVEYYCQVVKNKWHAKFRNTTRFDPEYNIHLFELIGIQHIFVVTMFLHFHKLKHDFLQSFKRQAPAESDAEVRKRHCARYYWFGRFLYEAVYYFGESGIQTDVDHFFHGIRTQVLFNAFNVSANAPVIATKSLVIAKNYADKQGVVCMVQPKYHGKINATSGVRIEWISHYAYEPEILYFGRYNQLQFWMLYKSETVKIKYRYLFHYFEALISRNAFNYHYFAVSQDGNKKIQREFIQHLIEPYKKHIQGTKTEFLNYNPNPNADPNSDPDYKSDAVVKRNPTTSADLYFFDVFENWCSKREFLDLSCILWRYDRMIPAVRKLFFTDENSKHVNVSLLKELFPNLKEFRNTKNVLVGVRETSTEIIAENIVNQMGELEFGLYSDPQQILHQKFIVLLIAVLKKLNIKYVQGELLDKKTKTQFKFEWILKNNEKYKRKLIEELQTLDLTFNNQKKLTNEQLYENVYDHITKWKDHVIVEPIWHCENCHHRNGKIMVGREWRFYNEAVQCGLCNANRFKQKAQAQEEKKEDEIFKSWIERIANREWDELKLIPASQSDLVLEVDISQRLATIIIQQAEMGKFAKSEITDEMRQELIVLLKESSIHSESALRDMKNKKFAKLTKSLSIKGATSRKVHKKVKACLNDDNACLNNPQTVKNETSICEQKSGDVQTCRGVHRILIVLKHFHILSSQATKNMQGGSKYKFSIAKILKSLVVSGDTEAYDSILIKDIEHFQKCHLHNDNDREILQYTMKQYFGLHPCVEIEMKIDNESKSTCLHLGRRFRPRQYDEYGLEVGQNLYLTSNQRDISFIDILDYCHSFLIHDILLEKPIHQSDNGPVDDDTKEFESEETDSEKDSNHDHASEPNRFSSGPGSGSGSGIQKEKLPLFGFGVFMEYDTLKPRYLNLTEELLLNDCQSVPLLQFMEQLKRVSGSNITRKAQVSNEYFGIVTGDDLDTEHILCVLLYCNSSVLCKAFRSTFRKHSENETEDDVRRRHCKYYYWFGRGLYCAIQFYGEQPKDDTVFYHGITDRFLFPSFLANFDTPTSTTIAFSVASRPSFSGAQGVVLKLRSKFKSNQSGHENRCLNVEFNCRFSDEKERLFFGLMNSFAIVGIVDNRTGKDLDKWVMAMNFFEKMIQQTLQNYDNYNLDLDAITPEFQDQYLLPLLKYQMAIADKNEQIVDDLRIKIPEYVCSLFSCICASQETIDLTVLCTNEKQFSKTSVKVRDFFFKHPGKFSKHYTNDGLEVEKIKKLFTRVARLRLNRCFKTPRIHGKTFKSHIRLKTERSEDDEPGIMPTLNLTQSGHV